MWKEIFNWIETHFPLLGLIVIVVAATIFIMSKYFHWTHKIVSTERDCNTISTNLTGLTSSINTLNIQFNTLIAYLRAKDGKKMDLALFKSKSPIQLTELGLRVLAAIGGKNYIEHNLQQLLKELDSNNIKTALDVQTFAPIVISKFSTYASFNKIKDYLYKNPYYKELDNDGEEISIPLDIGTITNIMGIYLRDKYLENHPELNPKDITEFAH